MNRLFKQLRICRFSPSSFIVHPFFILLLISACVHADQEAFLAPAFRIGTLELQSEASVYSSNITLKQICRWSHDDDAVFQPVADLVLSHFDAESFASIKADDIMNLLQGAGLTPAAVRLTGSAACTVSRVAAPVDPSTALAQWSQATDQSKSATQPSAPAPCGLAASACGEQSRTAASSPPHSNSENPILTLEDTLIHELATRLQIPVDSLQIQFDPRDDKLLSMTNPPFSFEIAPSRVHMLGNVSWDLTVRCGRTMQSVHIAAVARAWQNQVITANEVQYNQIIRPADLTEQRVLVDTLTDEPLLTKTQALGQQAAMDLKIGTVITSGKVAAVPLIRSGQLVTVSVAQGGINIQTEARALESATFGQPVRLRNETTHDIFQATVTGPQTAAVN